MAQSLLTGSFAIETLDPDRTGSSKTVAAADPGGGQATGRPAPVIRRLELRRLSVALEFGLRRAAGWYPGFGR